MIYIIHVVFYIEHNRHINLVFIGSIQVELHSTGIPKNNLNRFSVDSQQQEIIDSDVGHVFINNDDNNTSNSADDELELILSDDDQETMFYKSSSSFSSIDGEETLKSIIDIKKTFISFILSFT